MKKIELKSFIFGLMIGLIGITIVFTANKIKLVTYSNPVINLDGVQMPFKRPLLSVVKDGGKNTQIYIPLQEALEYLDYKVEWNSIDDTINILTSKTEIDTFKPKDNRGIEKNITKDSIKDEIDQRALETMQKTGNWTYIEPLIPYMSTDGIEQVISLYNEKQGKYGQHKIASDYINKNIDSDTVNSNQLDTKDDYDILARDTIKRTGDLNSIMVLLEYMNQSTIDEIAIKYIADTNDFNGIYGVCQYMSTEAIDKAAIYYIDTTGDFNTVAAILQFMSDDESSYIATKYIKESADYTYISLFTPYLQNK